MSDPTYAIIVNPASNTGRLKKKWLKVLPKVEEKFKEYDQAFTWHFTEAPLQSKEIAEGLWNEGIRNFIAVGGDGIANELGNWILENNKDIPLGVVPMGTSNDMHITLNMPMDPIENFDLVLNGEPKPYPVGKATGDFNGSGAAYFLNHSDCGLSSLAAKSSRDGWKIIKGEFKYTFHALKQLTKFRRNQARITIDGEAKELDLTVFAAGFGEGMGGYKLWPDNSIDKNGFGIVLAYGQSRFQLLKLMLAAEKGKHIGKPGVEYTRGKKIEIELDREWPFQAEGEMYTENSQKVEFEYVPNAIKYYTE